MQKIEYANKSRPLESLPVREADIYISLLIGGPKKAWEIADRMSLTRTETYHLLTSLQDKGLVTASYMYPVQFSAVPGRNR